MEKRNEMERKKQTVSKKERKMGKWRKPWLLAGAMLVLAMAVVGCGKGQKEEDAAEKEQAVIYPIRIDGSEIIIGETPVQVLLDKGYKVTVSEMTENKEIIEYEIDPEEELEANSYYSGASVWITESSFAHISIATEEENVRMGDAVIGRLEFSLVGEEKAELEKIVFNGVPLSEMTREKAGEVFPDFSGDNNMWFSPVEMLDYKYFMSFDAEGKINTLSLEKKYDVDWSGN